MIQKIKGRGFIFIALVSGVMVNCGSFFELNADVIRPEIDTIHGEVDDIEQGLNAFETDIENYEEETDTAFGDALPNTYSLDAGDPVGEGV